MKAENNKLLLSEYFPHNKEFLEYIRQLVDVDVLELPWEIKNQVVILIGEVVLRLLSKSKNVHLFINLSQKLLQLIQSNTHFASVFMRRFLLDDETEIPQLL